MTNQNPPRVNVSRPRHIVIGATEYQIRWSRKAIKRHAKRQEDREASYYGYANVVTSTICINPDASLGQQRDTLLHEVLHAIAHTYHVQWRKNEEHMVRILTPLLLATMRDNPQLIDWLTD